MKRRRAGTLLAAAAIALVALSCAASAGRYGVAADPGSRYNFQFVRDKQTGRWVHREFEIRVDLQRELPELRIASEIGNRFSVQLFRPISVSSGGIFSAIPKVEGNYRVWYGADVPDEADLKGQVAYSVSISWPDPGRETRVEPMEVFPMPPLVDTVPEQWSAWATAATMRAGAFGWWDEVHGAPPEAAVLPPHPFEFRWRLVYAEIPGRIP